jgi:hypothetical protein
MVDPGLSEIISDYPRISLKSGIVPYMLGIPVGNGPAGNEMARGCW